MINITETEVTADNLIEQLEKIQGKTVYININGAVNSAPFELRDFEFYKFKNGDLRLCFSGRGYEENGFMDIKEKDILGALGDIETDIIIFLKNGLSIQLEMEVA